MYFMPMNPGMISPDQLGAPPGDDKNNQQNPTMYMQPVYMYNPTQMPGGEEGSPQMPMFMPMMNPYMPQMPMAPANFKPDESEKK